MLPSSHHHYYHHLLFITTTTTAIITYIQEIVRIIVSTMITITYEYELNLMGTFIIKYREVIKLDML